MLSLTRSAISRTQGCVGKLSKSELSFTVKSGCQSRLAPPLTFGGCAFPSTAPACARKPRPRLSGRDDRRAPGGWLSMRDRCVSLLRGAGDRKYWVVCVQRGGNLVRSVDRRVETEKSVAESSAPGCRSQR